MVPSSSGVDRPGSANRGTERLERGYKGPILACSLGNER